MTVLSTTTRDPLSRYQYRRPLHDSPGGDVARRHPTLPDSAYYEAVRAANEREEALKRNRQNGSPTIANEENV